MSSLQPPLDVRNTANQEAAGNNEPCTSQRRNVEEINEIIHTDKQPNRKTGETAILNHVQPEITRRMTDALLEKVVPTLIKLERPKLPVFDGDAIDYASKVCMTMSKN